MQLYENALNSYSHAVVARDCADVKTALGASYAANTYNIFPDATTNTATPVQCDADGYTVIQSRGQFGNTAGMFNVPWANYKAGFGTAGT